MYQILSNIDKQQTLQETQETTGKYCREIQSAGNQRTLEITEEIEPGNALRKHSEY